MRNGDVTVEQLKQLVEIQTQIVKEAQQIKLAKKSGNGIQRKLVTGPRRLMRFLFQLW